MFDRRLALKLHVDIERMVLADRSITGQVFEQHHRTGSQVYQEADKANERLQVHRFRLSNSGWYRSRAHDPQTTVWNVRAASLSAICGISWITVSNDTSHST